MTGEFPAQMASYAENFSIWWRHYGPYQTCQQLEPLTGYPGIVACLTKSDGKCSIARKLNVLKCKLSQPPTTMHHAKFILVNCTACNLSLTTVGYDYFSYEEITIWIRFPYLWHFVRKIHRDRDFLPRRPVMWSFGDFFVVGLNKPLNAQSIWRWLRRNDAHITSL